MPSRNESMRAIARLQKETPISDDASLLELQEQAADYVREAKRRAPSEPDELVSSVLDAVARDYFRHAIKKQRTRRRRVLPVLLVLSVMTLFAAPAFAQTDYDGTWNVTVVTKTGSCQPTTSYPLVVTDGSVSGAAIGQAASDEMAWSELRSGGLMPTGNSAAMPVPEDGFGIGRNTLQRPMDGDKAVSGVGDDLEWGRLLARLLMIG